MTGPIDMARYLAYFQQKDERGFDFFFRLWYKPLCIFADRYTCQLDIAQDIVTDVFIRLWQRHAEFSHENALRSYLYQSVKNACLDYLKKTKKEEIQIIEETRTVLDNIIRAEVLSEISLTIGHLPGQCQIVFLKLYAEGKTTREVADELQLSISTVKTQKARALKFIRGKLLKR